METVSGKELSKIGIGSYGVGGRGHRDIPLTEKLEDKVFIDALVYSLNKGMNFTEIALGYGHGNSLSLFKQALDKGSVGREDIFLTHSFYLRDLLSMDVMKKDLSDFYKIMNTDYADSTLVTQSIIQKFGQESIYSLLNELLDKNQTRYVSLSNANIEFIKSFKKEFGNKFFAHEGHLSFEVRALQDEGIFDVCDKLGVKNIIWRSLRKGKTLQHNWELLVKLAKKYNKTQSQIVLNWICSLGYSPMVFSVNRKHIDENLQSVEFEMSREDYRLITDFRPLNYHPPQVNWNEISIADDIVTLCDDFEKHVN